MAELPSDPEQLARQILSGRMTIQQLAQEQARRRAAAQAASTLRPLPAPGQTAGRTAPAARPTSYQQMRQPSPSGMRTVPFPAPPSASRPSPAARAGQSAVAQGRPRQAAPKARSTERKPEGVKPVAGGAKPAAGGAKPTAGGATAASVQGPAVAKPTQPVTAPAAIAEAMLKDRRYLRSAFILTELLNKPLALRNESGEF